MVGTRTSEADRKFRPRGNLSSRGNENNAEGPQEDMERKKIEEGEDPASKSEAASMNSATNTPKRQQNTISPLFQPQNTQTCVHI